MKKMLFIMNAHAGRKQGAHALADILQEFVSGGWMPTVLFTQKRGDATEFVKEYGAEYEMAVCAGGDGTFNETAAGLLQSGLDIPLGYIPAGSTNDFAASMGLSTQVIQAARDIVEGAPRRIDLGCFNGRYFSYVASFGAFTRTSYATPQSLKNSLGHVAYLLEGVKDLSSLKSVKVSVTSDGDTLEEDCLFGAVTNATSLGGVLKLDPEMVDLSDGLLEVLLIRSPRNPIEFAQVVQALTSGHFDWSPCISFRRASRIVIGSETVLPWSLDGEEEPGGTEAVIENVPGAIRVVVPER